MTVRQISGGSACTASIPARAQEVHLIGQMKEAAARAGGVEGGRQSSDSLGLVSLPSSPGMGSLGRKQR